MRIFVDANVLFSAAKSDGAVRQLLIPLEKSGHECCVESLPLPVKDRPVLAAAIHQSCGALVTSDRTHFGPLYGRTIPGVTIHSPRSIAEALLVQREVAAA